MNNKDSTIWILIALFVLIIILFSGGGMMMSGAGFGMGSGIILMVLFWGAVIWLVISLISNVTKRSGETFESAISILKKRYAKGEITKEQYHEMEKELTK